MSMTRRKERITFACAFLSILGLTVLFTVLSAIMAHVLGDSISIDEHVQSKQIRAGARNHPPLFSDDIINPHPYNFIVANKEHCLNVTSSSGDPPFLVILVKVSPRDFYDRQMIRRTWGGVRTVGGKITTTLFLLGLHLEHKVNDEIQEENGIYGDIIQEDFADSYLNLTIKNIMGMKWVNGFCPNATYVASADADVMLNTYNLVRRLIRKPRRRFAEGSLRKNVVPVRIPHKHKKWLTSSELYPEATYAPFFPGSCYVMSGDVASDIYLQSQHVRYLPWDDVFNGLVMKRVGIEPRYAKGYEQYVRLNSSRSISKALKRGVAVLIHHQRNRIDSRLLGLWKSATSDVQRQHSGLSSLQILISVGVVCMVIVLSFLCGVTVMTL